MPFQRIPDTVDVNAKIAAYDGPIDGLYTVGNPAAAHAEIGTNTGGASGIRLYGPDGVTVLIDLDAATGNGTFQGDIVGSTITGSTITGGTVQTATSGQRVVLNGASDEIDFYDNLGTFAGSMQGSAGELFLSTNTQINGLLSAAEVSTTGNDSFGGPGSTTSFPGNIAARTGGTSQGWAVGLGLTAQTIVASSTVQGSTLTSTSGDVVAALTCQLNNPPTTSTAANAWINTSTGRINKSTSSRRYKTKIRRLRDGWRVMALRPVTFQDKAEAKADPTSRRYWGLIAEEVAQVLPEVVSYDAKGRPESVMYDRVVVGLLDVVRDLTARLDRIESAPSA